MSTEENQTQQPTDTAREAAEPMAERQGEYDPAMEQLNDQHNTALDTIAALRREVEGLKEPRCLTCERIMSQDKPGLWMCWECDADGGKQINAALAKLDICKRYAQGECSDGDCGELANDYGGTDYEKDPAVQSVANLVTERDAAQAQLAAMTKERDEAREARERWIDNAASTAKQRDTALARGEALHVHLGNMLDEVRTTKRGDWPRDLFCVECDCNVSKQEPHKPSCKIGQANAVWDAIDATGTPERPLCQQFGGDETGGTEG